MRRYRLLAGAVSSLIVVSVLGGCASTEVVDDPSDYSWTWAPITGATEVITAEDVPGLADEADIVALGRFTDVCEPRHVGGAGGDGQTYGCLTFRADSILAGEMAPEGIPVEFLGDPTGDGLPSSPSVVFLVDKGGVESGRYRVVNSAGLYTSTSRATVDQPMREHAPTSTKLSAHGLESESWEQFVDSVQKQLEKN